MLWSTLLVLGVAPFCVAKPLKRWDDLVEKHAWTEVPRGWALTAPAPAEHILDMRISMKQANLDQLIKSLYEVSDPAHEKYGEHLSQEDINALVAPHPDTVSLVSDWLSHHGIDASEAVPSTGAGDFITLRIPVAKAERMLGTTYNVFTHITTGESIVRTTSYSIPSVLQGHVDLVSPTTYFGTMRSMRATNFKQPGSKIIENDFELQKEVDSLASVPSSCSSTITPSCLRALYNTTSYKVTQENDNSLGIAGYLKEYANYADLQTFYKKYRTAAVGSNFTTEEVNGGKADQSQPGTEANLDIQYASGVAWPTPNIYYSTGGSPPYKADSNTPSNTNEPYLDWLNYITNKTDIPQTFTTSYGDDEQTVPIDYAQKVCNLFAQLGARGSTVIFSSGDSGVGAGDCKTNDGKDKTVFQPAFPAGCPYVTTVGATTGISPEVSTDWSGGGFSNYFATPDYQSDAVKSYLKSFTKYSKYFNASGRAYPDVSAQGLNFQVVIGGSVESVAGTSASAPTFAGVVALLNDYRLSQGKKSLGFLNPLIYADNATSAFNDITSGTNAGCNTDGFEATKGWDPVTGLGTPDFGKLQAVVV